MFRQQIVCAGMVEVLIKSIKFDILNRQIHSISQIDLDQVLYSLFRTMFYLNGDDMQKVSGTSVCEFVSVLI